MDFRKIILNILASFVIVLRRLIYLIVTPYKTMREISLRNDYYQLGIIFFAALLYFIFAYNLRRSVWWGIMAYGAFIVLFLITVVFFYVMSFPTKNKIKLDSFIITFGYTLVPTLIWFISNLFLFIILPPPRTMSVLGRGFSIFFIAYSLSLLVWKLILVYFAIRFSSRLGLYRIIYLFLIYIAIFIPLSLLFYYFKIFRIPFI